MTSAVPVGRDGSDPGSDRSLSWRWLRRQLAHASPPAHQQSSHAVPYATMHSPSIQLRMISMGARAHVKQSSDVRPHNAISQARHCSGQQQSSSSISRHGRNSMIKGMAMNVANIIRTARMSCNTLRADDECCGRNTLQACMHV